MKKAKKDIGLKYLKLLYKYCILRIATSSGLFLLIPLTEGVSSEHKCSGFVATSDLRGFFMREN
jgi:hypothetical protein